MNDQQRTDFEQTAKIYGFTDFQLCEGAYCKGAELNNFYIGYQAGRASFSSPEVEALRKDAERYRKLVADWLDNVHGREFGLINDMPSEAYESKADVDAAIDATMEKQK